MRRCQQRSHAMRLRVHASAHTHPGRRHAQTPLTAASCLLLSARYLTSCVFMSSSSSWLYLLACVDLCVRVCVCMCVRGLQDAPQTCQHVGTLRRDVGASTHSSSCAPQRTAECARRPWSARSAWQSRTHPGCAPPPCSPATAGGGRGAGQGRAAVATPSASDRARACGAVRLVPSTSRHTLSVFCFLW
jgi:hypothetical protein